jgi:pimeloyl-ACP methyl ester carboxylesterase
MARIPLNGAEIFYEVAGEGDPVLLIHGSWTDHTCWEQVVPKVAEQYRVVTYDRRGHSQSERPPSQGSRREDEDDATALLEALGCVPAHVVGNSFGASITLGLAARRPDLFRSAMPHEPPLLATLADDPHFQPELQALQPKLQSVLEQLEGGNIPGGTREFVQVALGPRCGNNSQQRIARSFLTTP